MHPYPLLAKYLRLGFPNIQMMRIWLKGKDMDLFRLWMLHQFPKRHSLNPTTMIGEPRYQHGAVIRLIISSRFSAASMQLYLDVVFLVISEPKLDAGFSLKAKSCSNHSAPSKARLYQSGVEPDLGNPGKDRVPSVAVASVTMSAKRTQGDDGLQCSSVKG